MKWKLFLLSIVSAGSLCGAKLPELYFNPPPRELKLSKEMTTLIQNGKSDLEIVAPQEAGDTALFAGEEIQKYLQQGTKAKIPLLRQRGSAKYAIILGDNAMLKKAFPKVDLAKLHLDGFYTLKKGNEIYIAGRDTIPGRKLRNFLETATGNWLNMQLFERATLFGAYDFLERFAGIRFFFAGEMGTVVPDLKELKIPSTIHIMDRPDFTTRRVSWYVGRRNKDEWYDDQDPITGCNLNYLRWRLETRAIPNCHGLAWIGYHHRFAKTNPEFFAMYENGKRIAVKHQNFAGQLCLSSKGLREEIYKDVKSYLLGEPASVRGVTFNGKTVMWPGSGFQPGFVNVMPQDAFYMCRCPDCQKYFSKGRVASSNLIWEMTAEIANRVKKDKLPGYVTQMAYHFYAAVPTVKLPDNVLVMYASYGPWVEGKKACKDDDEAIEQWTKKLNSKVAFWNYCINNAKWSQSYGVMGMPHTTPKNIANYYQKRKKYFYGGFLECETDHFIWGVPNIYAATKIFWNNDLDVNAMMDDFYSKLFNAAAPEMKEFFETLEKKWLASRTTIETPTGPQHLPVTQFAVWTKIYPPAEIKRLDGIFDRAEQKVKNDAMALKRVKFFRERFLDVIKAHSARYIANSQDKAEVRLVANKRTKEIDLTKPIRIPGNTGYLRSLKKPQTDISVQTVVTKDDKNLYITFRCEEPEMKKLLFSRDKAAAKKNVWKEALFEIFLNPSGDRVNFYQIAIHPSGYMTTIVHPNRKEWDAALKVRTYIGKNFWSGELAIPLNALKNSTGEFPFNVGYSRQFAGEDPYSRTYAWSPYIKDAFNQSDKFGLLAVENKNPDKNIVKDWNFDAEFDGFKLGAWHVAYPSDSDFEGALEPDSSRFVTGGQSIYLRMDAGKRGVSAQQNLKLKPDTEYTFSYWIKHNIDHSSGANAVVYVGKNIFMPELQMRGNLDWHKKSFTFRTPKNFNGKANVRFSIHRPKAEMWIDNVRILEKKK